MWSLTWQRERRTSGPENFQSSAKKDFFNTIGTFQTWPTERAMSVSGRVKADDGRARFDFRFCAALRHADPVC